MLAGLAQIIETFGLDDDCLENTGVVVDSVSHIPAGAINDESLEIVLMDKDGNRRTYQLVEIDAGY